MTKLTIGGVAAMVLISASAIAGDREHVGGHMSSAAREANAINDDGTINVERLRNYYIGRIQPTPGGFPTIGDKLNQFMREWNTCGFCAFHEYPNTPDAPAIGHGVRGGISDYGGGIGSWGEGGGTGPGARGY